VEANRSYVYFRPEHNEAELARSAVQARAISVGIIRSKYLAPQLESGDGSGRDHEELAAAFRSADGPYLVDPDTPALCASGLLEDEVERRLRLTDAAQAVELPLQLRTLRDDQARIDFVNVNVGMQAGAAGVVSPYLEAHRENDPRLAVNLAMLRDTISVVSDGRPVIAVLQTTGYCLRKGFVKDVAPLYAATGVKRVLVRIRRFDPEEATASELTAYLDAIASFAAHNIGIVPDCVGRLGPALVAGGAHAFGTGSRFFRKVADSPINTGGGGGGGDLEYEVPGRLRSVAISARRSSNVPRCMVEGCAARAAILDNGAIRLHNLHALNAVAQLAARLGSAVFAEYLAKDGDEREREWASVLRERVQRAA
jgi:hypothetical protein